MNKDKHKLYMAQILGLIFRDKELCRLLAFKGGTALMFFHDLPRFSTDLNFNLLDPTKEREVFTKVRSILQRFGTIDDEAIKHYGILLVLNYEKGERMLEKMAEYAVEDLTKAFAYMSQKEKFNYSDF